MIVATAPFIAGHRVIETKGQTFGLVVRSRGFSGSQVACNPYVGVATARS